MSASRTLVVRDMRSNMAAAGECGTRAVPSAFNEDPPLRVGGMSDIHPLVRPADCSREGPPHTGRGERRDHSGTCDT
jgi:hypothetical protein